MERDADRAGVRADAVARTRADTFAVPAATREDPIRDDAAAGASLEPYWRGLLSLV
jgi:hypothetical protein